MKINMFFYCLILYILITAISGCSIIKDTAILSADTSYKSVSLIEDLELDNHQNLMFKLSYNQEEFARSCEKIDSMTMNNLEDDSLLIQITTFFKWMLGETDMLKCQESVIQIKTVIDDIIKQYPKQYGIYSITLPDYLLPFDEEL